jgi:hypothetical protein
MFGLGHVDRVCKTDESAHEGIKLCAIWLAAGHASPDKQGIQLGAIQVEKADQA